MLDLMLRHLEDSGARVGVVGTEVPLPGGGRADAVVDVCLDGHTARFVVEERRRSPYLGEVGLLADHATAAESIGAPMLFAPFITEGVASALAGLGWSWVDKMGNYDVRAPGLRLRQRLSTAPPAPQPAGLPRGSASWAVIRWLVATASVPDLRPLMELPGVTKPRAYQVASSLAKLGLVEHKGRGPWLVEREALLDRFLAEYPGPGGSAAYFYSRQAPLELARQLVPAAGDGGVVVSADVGPDLVAPWRRPTHLVVYARPLARLGNHAGLVPAHGPDDANVTCRYPEDRSVTALAGPVSADGDRLMVADPVQLIWELGALGGDDRLEAADKLRTWLLSR